MENELCKEDPNLRAFQALDVRQDVLEFATTREQSTRTPVCSLRARWSLLPTIMVRKKRGRFYSGSGWSVRSGSGESMELHSQAGEASHPHPWMWQLLRNGQVLHAVQRPKQQAQHTFSSAS